jgi:hypothetical protein
LLSAGAAQVLITTMPTNTLQRLARACLPLMAWLIVIEVLAIFGRNMIATRSRDQVMGALAAEWVDQHMDSFVEEGEHLGCWHSGILQYYTPRHTVINLDGLANNDILRVLRGELTMNEYWDERNIRVILGEPREKMGAYEQAWGDKHLAVVESFRAGKREVTVKRVERAAPASAPHP